jgi:hypothetical protein
MYPLSFAHYIGVSGQEEYREGRQQDFCHEGSKEGELRG